MKKLNTRIILILVFISSFISSITFSQEKKKLSIEWRYSPEAMAITRLPNVQWLKNGSIMIYDMNKPAEERTIQLLNPSTMISTPVMDFKKAIESLKNLLADKTPPLIQMPNTFDKNGEKGFYIFSGDIFLLNMKDAAFERVTNTKEEEKNVKFSPDGEKLSYVRSNNIYIYDIKSKTEKAVTIDGSDTILNGTLSWVYWEEIFGRADIAYWWSNDSKAIAYLQTDESTVSLMYYSDFKPAVPNVIKQRYPKTGDPNPVVKVGIAEIETSKTTWIDFANNPFEYIIRVNWLPDSKQIAVQTMNRMQDELNLIFADRLTGKVKPIFKETDPAWVNISDDLHFIKNGEEFFWASERSGYAHLYLYSSDGKLINQVTKGEWAVAASGGSAYWVRKSISVVDEKNKILYFTAQEKAATEKHLYKINFDGTGMKRLSMEDGTHAINFSPDANYYFDTYSNIKTPPILSLYKNDGKLIKQIGSYDAVKLASLDLQRPEQFTIPAHDGFPLPAEILKPKDFDPNKKYPLIIYVYGGPSAPQVLNRWRGSLYFDQLLLDNGFLVALIDPRNATAISKKLENLLNRNLGGEVELNDLVDGVKWFKKQTYIDPSRVGVWGWSGGGTYTLNAMTHSKEFKAGIAVAAVTDWHFYDSKFGESVMKTAGVNPEGYEKTSLVKSAKNLSGRLMIVHGTYDDNVHIQNAYAFMDELIKANIMFDLMIYPMRQHGISDSPAQIHLYNKMLEFWKKNL
jgi:dipeptidyl-peptidase-4